MMGPLELLACWPAVCVWVQFYCKVLSGCSLLFSVKFQLAASTKQQKPRNVWIHPKSFLCFTANLQKQTKSCSESISASPVIGWGPFLSLGRNKRLERFRFIWEAEGGSCSSLWCTECFCILKTSLRTPEVNRLWCLSLCTSFLRPATSFRPHEEQTRRTFDSFVVWSADSGPGGSHRTSSCSER